MAKKYMRRRVQIEFFGDDYAKIISDYGPEALFFAGEVVQREAERRAPQGRTGNLKKSGYVSTKWRTTYVRRMYWRREKKPKAMDDAVIGFTAPHAHLLEGGRRRSGKIYPLKRRGTKALFIHGRFRAASRYRRMSSRPFLGPAIDATRDTLVEELSKRYGSVLERLLPGSA